MLIAFARLDGSHYRGATCRGARAHVALNGRGGRRLGARRLHPPPLARRSARTHRAAHNTATRGRCSERRYPVCPARARARPCDAPSCLAPGCRRNLRSGALTAVVASMDPMQRATLRATRHAMRMAGTTALQDLLAEVAGRRRLSGARYSREDPRLGSRPRRRAARGGACGAGYGGCTDDACEESHAAARGGDGTAARARTRRRGRSRS